MRKGPCKNFLILLLFRIPRIKFKKRTVFCIGNDFGNDLSYDLSKQNLNLCNCGL